MSLNCQSIDRLSVCYSVKNYNIFNEFPKAFGIIYISRTFKYNCYFENDWSL